MQYALFRKLVREYVDADGQARVDMPASLLRTLLIAAIRGRGLFDAEFYRAANADVAEAVDRSVLRSVEEHYYMTGYFEGRLPQPIVVDESYYLRHNTDVAEAIRSGMPISAQSHFEHAGFSEGRLPYAGFSLF